MESHSAGSILMKQLNIAIIGQGRSGRDIHGAFLLSDKSDRFKVTAVVDKLEDRRERARNEFGCDVYEDYHSLFERDDIDLVINSTYSYMHYPITLDLLKHGLNVVVEKPFAMHRADCLEMIETARDNGVMLNVFQQSRFAPYYVEIKKIIESGVLGKIQQININFSGFSRRWDWQCIQSFGGGSLYNTGPHPFDQALDLLGFDPDARLIYSKLDSLNSYGDAEDYVKLMLTAPGKPLIDLEISSCCAYKPYTYLIHAKNGSLTATNSVIDYKYFVPAEAPEQHLITESLRNTNGHPMYCSEKLDWHTEHTELTGSAFDTAVSEYYTMIYEHLVNNRPMEIVPEQSMQQIGMMEKAHADNPLPVRY